MVRTICHYHSEGENDEHVDNGNRWTRAGDARRGRGQEDPGLAGQHREGHHEWNRELFREAGISFVAGGHYNTEKLGVLALGDMIGERFDVEVELLDLPNEV